MSSPTTTEPLLSDVCLAKAKRWKYQKHLWKHIGFVERRHTSKGYIRSRSCVRRDKLPLDKGQIVAVTTGPLDLRPYQVFYIGIIEKSRIKTSTVKIIHVIDKGSYNVKVGDTDFIDNYDLALPRSTTFDLIEKKSRQKRNKTIPEN